MTPLLASGDPFEHTWNTWEFAGIDLRTVPGFERFGITNAVVSMWIVALILVLLGVRAGSEAKRAQAEGRTPRGIGHAFEVVVDFIRTQIMKPQMPHHWEKGFFTAFFCTIFFFILCCNLIGLLPPPFGHTPTGTFLLNAGLAVGATFVTIIGAGIWEKGFLGFFGGLVPHGVPFWLWPLIFVIEIVGLLVKPFSLTIRLTANMTAGHIILAVLMGFLTAAINSVVVQGLVWASSGFGYLAISAFEIAIAFIQAYIFTTLSAVFVGQSLSHEH